jgi:glycosyltransferase involved in cell wall biosynthesis
MRVVRVIARLNIGGPARQVVVLDQGLRALGCDTLLVYGAPGTAEGALDDLARERGVPTIVMPTLGRRISVLRDGITAFRLIRILFASRPDVVHTHTAKAGTLGRLAGAIYNLTRPRAQRCAIVHTFHGNVFSGYFGRVGSGLTRMTERALARVTDRIITLSPQQCDEITTRFRIASRDRVEVVAAGHDLERLLALEPGDDRLRRELGWNGQHVVIGYVGRLVGIKDVQTLLRAVAAIAAGCPQVRLLVAGDGGERAALEDLARALNLDGITRFIGWSTDLSRLYAAIDIVALTSLNEGMPASLIEGMAAGRPVVATRVGGVPELVTDGENGHLVAARDVPAVARALESLATDAARRAAFGERARLAVGRRFAPERLARETLLVYEAALASRRGPSSAKRPASASEL